MKLVAVYKLDPYRKRCPELLNMFQCEKDAISFCDLYDWEVLDADTGLMYDMIIASKYERMVFSGNTTMTKILSKTNIFKRGERTMTRLTINHPDRMVDVSTTPDAMTCEDYYTKIDELLSSAREELTPQDMMKLINDLGVVLDMHFDGIRREVEGEYDEE